jgi:hypothetical protein
MEEPAVSILRSEATLWMMVALKWAVLSVGQEQASTVRCENDLHDIDKLNMNKTFQIVNKWFQSNLLSLNYEKTLCIKFRTKNSIQNDNKIMYGNNIISNISHTKFLGLTLYSTSSWSKNIEGLINKLSSVCYMLRSVKPYMSQVSLMMIYYALFHSAMSYGIIFWGNSPHSQKIFRLQKRAIRIITGSRSRVSCRNLFKQLG